MPDGTAFDRAPRDVGPDFSDFKHVEHDGEHYIKEEGESDAWISCDMVAEPWP